VGEGYNFYDFLIPPNSAILPIQKLNSKKISSMTTALKLFATSPKGLELLLADELRAFGATMAAEKLAGVEFTGDLAVAYKACLWSRLANRILLRLARVPAATPEELYAGVQTVNWYEHLDENGTLAVNFVSSQSVITHTLFGAQKVKDAIVDQFREKFQVRPSVAKDQPQLSVNVYLHRDEATIYIDLSGESLHRRGYRLAAGAAPLKENLAAAILMRAGWSAIAKTGGMLLDPMCGSGTLLIEGAMIAADIAPGLARQYFGFLEWKHHQPKLWEQLLAEATARRASGLLTLPPIIGYDVDPNAIKIAFENIERADLRGKIHVEKRELAMLVSPKANDIAGLVVVNPPYGERLGEIEELQPLYTLLGTKLKECFSGWQAAVFTGNPDLGKVMGLRARRYYAFYNGPLPCKLLLFDVSPEKFIDRSPGADNERLVRAAQEAVVGVDTQVIQMFVNRLRKNLRHLKRIAERQGLASYRVYDGDLPEYAFAIDIDKDAVKVVEYEAPRSVDPEKVLRRRQEILAVLPAELQVLPAQIFFSVVARDIKI
jgi:23S rRNA (guanine2445-N2)-methyltransferase / 23S rRNA (guanine2069-N7)-methyltransferase